MLISRTYFCPTSKKTRLKTRWYSLVQFDDESLARWNVQFLEENVLIQSIGRSDDDVATVIERRQILQFGRVAEIGDEYVRVSPWIPSFYHDYLILRVPFRGLGGGKKKKEEGIVERIRTIRKGFFNAGS